VIVASPTFLIYEIQSAIQEAKIKKVPLKNYGYDLDAMARAVTSRTKIIFISNPDNPSGTYVNQKKMLEFLKKINKDVLIFLDEAYFEFAPADFPKTAQFLKTYKNIIFSRTFSKAYGLAGLRIGYGVADSEIIANLNKVREPFNVNRFSQVAAVAALNEKAYLKRVIEFTNKEKKYFYDQLTKLGVKYIESATNFVLIDFGRDTALLDAFMLKNGIIVRSLKGWGLDTFIRVTVGLPKENKKFVKILADFLKQDKL
ncbi:MAG: histidinol-phosphate transaminase, partial [Candidatus Omnitrophica bacterium]|nr:histidinol-phosphate transaminase [Candidatus Omnitrophota bacterium]